MTREELIQSKEYWLAKLQIDLFNEVESYMKKNGLNRVQFAEKLGVSKGYVSQILNGDADHRMSKFVELALSIGLIPTISFEEIETLKEREKSGNFNITHNDIERSINILSQSGYLLSHKPVNACNKAIDTSDDNPNWKKLISKPESASSLKAS
jgi:transcriptional regulator with XRE-family HTH domain